MIILQLVGGSSTAVEQPLLRPLALVDYLHHRSNQEKVELGRTMERCLRNRCGQSMCAEGDQGCTSNNLTIHHPPCYHVRSLAILYGKNS